VRAQRASIARTYLAKPPAGARGTFVYSNLGYILAGAIAEARTGKPWEVLVRERVFEPLGITHAGFGAPGTPGKLDQPLGHQKEGGKLVPIPAGPDGDNPPALGPAGTMHITLSDWMLFAQDQLDGVHGRGKLLRPETYRKLHTPVTVNYALGWGAKLETDGTPAVLTHTGSNGAWLAEIRIFPKHGAIVLIAMNAEDAGAKAAMDELGDAFRAKLKPYD
jgi:CubicO group peptidase (beta-lactamase class C family)